jgi:hypothetical protein
MRGTFMIKSHFHPEGGNPRELPGGTDFAFADDPPLIVGERVRIEIDGEPGWADTAAVIAENGDTGLLIAGKRQEIQQVASVSGFVAHCVRNPHHRNSPDLDKALSFEQDTGRFRLTIQDFLDVFHNVTYAVVARDV